MRRTAAPSDNGAAMLPSLAARTARSAGIRSHAPEQHIKEGKNAIRLTRLSCRKFRNNEIRLQFHALAYKLGNFMPTLALPKAVERWSLTTLREKLIKIGANPSFPFYR